MQGSRSRSDFQNARTGTASTAAAWRSLPRLCIEIITALQVSHVYSLSSLSNRNCTVHGVAKSYQRLSRVHTSRVVINDSACLLQLVVEMKTCLPKAYEIFPILTFPIDVWHPGLDVLVLGVTRSQTTSPSRVLLLLLKKQGDYVYVYWRVYSWSSSHVFAKILEGP